MTRPQKQTRAARYLGNAQRWPHHFLFPEAYFRQRIRDVAPVPGYFYHQPVPTEFEEICKGLTGNGFRTLTFSDLLDGGQPTARSVTISFDDGWSSVWSVAFPIARRYGVRFTLFVVPELISDSNECRATIDDGADYSSLAERDQSPGRFLTWAEIGAMHDSGLVDIQSHTSHHGVVFASDKLLGFASPSGPFPLNGMSPCVLREDGVDEAFSSLPYGTPIYEWAPALAARVRFLDSEGARRNCARIVEENGGVEFFEREGWDKELQAECAVFTDSSWESDQDRRLRMRRDLETAKINIETRLPGKQVRVVAPPWALMHPDLSSIAEDTGHELIVLGYPFPGFDTSHGPAVYPRLYGDSIWNLIHGPLRGAFHWMRSRKQAIARVAEGAIP
jgi:hypothetical protein